MNQKSLIQRPVLIWVIVDDFDHTPHLRLFFNSNGDLQARPGRRNPERMRAKLINHGCGRHWLPVVQRRSFASFHQRSQDIRFSGHAAFIASRVPEMCRGVGNKCDTNAKKVFFSRGRACPTFRRMKRPGLIREIGSRNLQASRPAKATSDTI